MAQILDLTENKKVNETPTISKGNIEVSKTNELLDLTDVFTDSFSQMKSFAEIHKMTEVVVSQINNLLKAVTGKTINKDEIHEIYQKFESYNKPLGLLSNAEIYDILSSIPNIDFSKTTTKTNAEKDVFRKELLNLIISADGTYDLWGKAQQELNEHQKAWANEMDDLLGETSLSEKLLEVQDKIKDAKDENEKKRLENIYSGMYMSINLNILITKIHHKGLKIIKKEAKKDFEKAKKKCYQIMDNDKKNLLMNPDKLDTALYSLFPNDKEAITILLYLIYKRINKRNTLDIVTATFINYFILNVVKLKRETVKPEESELYSSIEKFISDFNSGKFE